jgi:RHS repeat-associated protein
MKGLESSDKQSTQNKKEHEFQFNAQTEREESFGLFWDETMFRTYDMQLGRFNHVDPMAEMRDWLSPYNFVQNNPILRVDPAGDVDTKYVDEDGEVLLETNDGSDDVITVSEERVEEFKEYGETYEENEGMRSVFDGQGWNDFWKKEFLGFESVEEMNYILDGFTTQWSRQNAIDYLQDPSPSNAFAMSLSESLSQWTDPFKVVGAASAGVLSLRGAARPRGSNVGKTIHSGKQGKHIVGHNNYQSGKSILNSDAQSLLDDFHAGNIRSSRVISESKTSVDFGKTIGNYVRDGVSTPTSVGTVINSKTGVHIVPANPIQD